MLEGIANSDLRAQINNIETYLLSLDGSAGLLDSDADQRAIKNGYNYMNNLILRWKKIKKYSIINFIGTILVCTIKYIQTYVMNSGSHYDRRLSALLGLFGTIPIVVISSIMFIIVVKYYIENNFKSPLLYSYLIIPFLMVLIPVIFLLGHLFWNGLF